MNKINESEEWPQTFLQTGSWCLKSLFFPIWWQLPRLSTHPHVLHFVSPIAPAANSINVNSNSLHSSLVTLLASTSPPPESTLPAVLSSFQLANSTCCQNVEVNWLSLLAVIAPMQATPSSLLTYIQLSFSWCPFCLAVAVGWVSLHSHSY